MRTRYLIFWALFVLFLVMSVNAQSPQKYVISHWNLDEGLPQSTVNSVIQTRDGYIWLATWGGLARFDGVQFVVFNRSNSPGMLSDRAVQLFEDREGNLWIGTEQGLVCYSGGQFRTYNKKDGFENELIVNIHQDDLGSIWVHTGGEILYKKSGNNFIRQEITNNESLKSRALNGEGGAWIVFHYTLCRYIEGKFVKVDDLRQKYSHSLRDVIETPDGKLYISTNGDGLIIYNKGNVKFLRKEDGLVSNNLRQLLLSKNNEIWVAARGGISIIANNKIFSITKEDGLSDSEVLNIIEDREGNYWAGTPSRGLEKIRKSIITVYGAPEGLNEEKLVSLCSLKNGTLLIGTNCGGIYELTEGKIRFSTLNKYLFNNCILSIFEDSKQRLWISAEDLVLVENKSIISFNSKNGFNGSMIWAIYEDREGTIWIGCNNGLFSYSNRKFTHYTTKDGMTDNEVRSIYEDNGRNLWIGTINGLNFMKSGIIKSFHFDHIKSSYIRSIYQDKDGAMWFGSYGGGLIRYKENQVNMLTSVEGLFDDIVSHLVEDQFGYLWMGSNRGISRVSIKELNAYIDSPLGNGKKKLIYSTSFGKQDGMETVETNGGFQPNTVKDKQGKIYFPTVQGLVVINPEEVMVNEKIPPLHIEKVFVAGKEVRQLQSIQAESDEGLHNVPYDSSDIQIQYTALSYIDPHKVKFRYKIEGYDKDWIEAGTRRTAYYTKVPPGEYKFIVIASNNDGIWNENGASISFVILPPYWMTWWFQGIMIIIFLAAGPVIYLVRVSELKKKQEIQHQLSRKLIESQEQERKRIAFELHDSLGQNLLIIKNKLLSGLRELKGEEITHFSDAADAVSNSIDEIREISQDLRPHHLDQLGLTLAIESKLDKIMDSTDIEIKVQLEAIDGLILQKNEINFYRIIQECFNNIVKHSGAATASITICNKEKKIYLLIEDDGKGIDEAYLNGREGSLGIIGMRERAKILGGEITFNSTGRIGTRVELIIPVESND